MKKTLSVLMLLMIALIASACGAKSAAPAEACYDLATDCAQYSLERSGGAGDMKASEDKAEVTAEEAEPLVYIALTQHADQMDAEDGSKLFVTRCVVPEMITEDEKVNGWLASVVDEAGNATLADIREVGQWAVSAWESREEDGIPFYAYSYYSDISAQRLDNVVISALQVISVYSGGAHPNNAQIAYNMDLNGQKRLELSDVILPGAWEGVQQLVLNQLDQRFGGLENSGLYPNYPQIVADSFASPGATPNWYFSANGLVIYYNCYDIAPYAAGIVKVELPYDVLDGLLVPDYYPDDYNPGEGSMRILDGAERPNVLYGATAGDWFYIGTDGIVRDVKVHKLTGWITDDVPIVGPMVFAVNRLTAEDALALPSDNYLLTYGIGGGEVRELVINPSEIREIVGEMAE